MVRRNCFCMDLMLNERKDSKAEFDIPSMGRDGLEQKLEQFKYGQLAKIENLQNWKQSLAKYTGKHYEILQ